MAGQFPSASYPAQSGIVSPNALLPVYPWYHWHQQSQAAVGVPPAHVFTPATAGPVTSIAAIVSKTAPAVPPTTGMPLGVVQSMYYSPSFTLKEQTGLILPPGYHSLFHLMERCTVCLAVEQVTGCS